jgi:hypothetical protein
MKRSESMKAILMRIILTLSLLFFLVADFPSQSPWGLGLIRNAEAIIGLPFTPFSFAGMARRSMYRHAVWDAAAANAAAANMAYANAAAANSAAANASAANAAAAQAAASNAAASAAAAQRAASVLPIGSTVPYLPPNCTSTVIHGASYFNCNGTYYKAGFEGNHIVYIVSAP